MFRLDLVLFEQQPVVRARGKYTADAAIAAAATKSADGANLVCNKNFASKRALTAGVFTIVCPHGMLADSALGRGIGPYARTSCE